MKNQPTSGAVVTVSNIAFGATIPAELAASVQERFLYALSKIPEQFRAYVMVVNHQAEGDKDRVYELKVDHAAFHASEPTAMGRNLSRANNREYYERMHSLFGHL
jgi:hypothetical protein